MDLQKHLIESTKNKRNRGGWKASVTSLAVHAMLVASIVYAGNQVTHTVDAEKPIAAFLSQGAAPPPPPPPPPPPAASKPQQAKAQPVRPKIKPVEVPVFTQPREIPKEVPKVEPTPDPKLEPVLDLTPDPDPAPSVDTGGTSEAAGAVEGGVVGGVAGGQVGGVVGGEVGGVIGGEIGGVKGGVVGGKLGGQVGGTGTGTEGTGTGGNDAPVVKAPEPPPPPPPPPAGPLRVGGDVKAPTTTHRVDPEYTETARAARVTGIVVVEALIDANGNVDEVKVVKGLPMGLSEAAVRAVKQWKFKPGTLNGKNVPVLFNLTVNFKMN